MEIIEGAAIRLAEDLAVVRSGQDEHGLEPGPHDDLATDAFATALVDAYQQTLSPGYVTRLGISLGAVVQLMELVGAKRAETANGHRWGLVQRHFHAVATAIAPNYPDRVGELPSLHLAVTPTSPIARFDMVAQAASRAGVLRLADAAAWVGELTQSLPELSNEDLAAGELFELDVLPTI